MINKPTPVAGDLGDISWVRLMFEWLGSRGILPQWVVQMLNFVMGILIPNTRGIAQDPKQIQKLQELEKNWNDFAVKQGLVPGDTGIMQGPRQER